MKKVFLIMVLFSVCHFYNIYAQTLNPGDGIRIIFYNISDKISGDYYIQANGYVGLPYLGQIKAVKINVDTLKNEIYTAYSKLYKNPELTILPIIRVNIFGEIKTPGYYYVTGTDKLSDLLAKAGGTTSDADLSDIKITRDNTSIEIDGEKAIEKGSKLNDIGLQSGDQIYVTKKWFTGTTSTLILTSVGIIASLIITLIYRGLL